MAESSRAAAQDQPRRPGASAALRGGGAPGDGPRRGMPLAVMVVVAALALEFLALAWLAVEAVLSMGTGALPAGAQVMLAVIYVLVAAWIGATAVGMARGRAWTRGAATAMQLFGALLAWWLISVEATALGVALLVVSGAALLALFMRDTTSHLDAGSRAGA